MEGNLVYFFLIDVHYEQGPMYTFTILSTEDRHKYLEKLKLCLIHG
jgi:hypothetical protein